MVTRNAIIQLGKMTDQAKRKSSMPFEKVRPRKVSAIAAQQLISAIKGGMFPVGSKLPSESELGEQMGVSRPSIREALSALQAVGLITARPGSGNYVIKVPSSDEEQDAPHLIESEAGCLEVMEARSVLEPPVAAYVASQHSPEEIEALRDILVKMREEAQKGDFAPYFEADKAFHSGLVDAAHSHLITEAIIPLVDTMDQKLYREFTHHYYLKNVADLEQVVGVHCEILDAIAQGNPLVAAEKVDEHWRRMMEIWEA